MGNGENICFIPNDDHHERIEELTSEGYSRSEAVRKLLDVALEKEASYALSLVPKLRFWGEHVAMFAILVSVGLYFAPMIEVSRAGAFLVSFGGIGLFLMVLAEVLDSQLKEEDVGSGQVTDG